MDLSSCVVSLASCRSYAPTVLKEKIDVICRSLSYAVTPGSRVLLKPNLVSYKGHDGLAVTNPRFVAAVVEWFVDAGAHVSIGDSPAFGSAMKVMDCCGMTEALRGLPIRVVSFSRQRRLTTAHGFPVVVAGEVFDCDYLVSLPKVKAHGQMRVTLSVKNFLGVMLGWRKVMSHMRYGGRQQRFSALLVDLLSVLPDSLSLIDGVVAMHRSGPIDGHSFAAQVIGGSTNPVALDTAILDVIQVLPQSTPLWQECAARELVGCRAAELIWPLAKPDQLRVKGFITPKRLLPVRFRLSEVFLSFVKRLVKI